MGDFGYKPPVKSIHGWVVGGTHKAWYKVRQEDYPTINRERVYIACSCNLGYDHEASMDSNPPYESVVSPALTKLTIELFKQGILKRGDV